MGGTFAVLVEVSGIGPGDVMTLKGVVEVGEGEEPEGEGTGSTELSDIRLLGRCQRQRNDAG